MDSPVSLRLHKCLCTKQKKGRRKKLIKKYGYQCFWCECDLTPEILTIDHYIPLHRGGNNEIQNLRLACTDCNTRRGDAMPEETLRVIYESRQRKPRQKIRIPRGWTNLKYCLGQKVKQGQIVGIIYHPPGTKRALECGERWTYFVLADDQADEIDSYSQLEIKPINEALV